VVGGEFRNVFGSFRNATHARMVLRIGSFEGTFHSLSMRSPDASKHGSGKPAAPLVEGHSPLKCEPFWHLVQIGAPVTSRVVPTISAKQGMLRRYRKATLPGLSCPGLPPPPPLLLPPCPEGVGFPLTGVPVPVGAGDGVKGPGTVVAWSAALAASREAGSTKSMSLLDSQP